MQRDRLVHTFGVLLAGMLQVEKSAEGTRQPRRRVRHGSGVYPRPTTQPPPTLLSEPPPAL
jgi:hypothetical protein